MGIQHWRRLIFEVLFFLRWFYLSIFIRIRTTVNSVLSRARSVFYQRSPFLLGGIPGFVLDKYGNQKAPSSSASVTHIGFRGHRLVFPKNDMSILELLQVESLTYLGMVGLCCSLTY